MTTIQNACYRMQLRGGGDLWRIQGNVYGHPSATDGDLMYPSCPVSFDETTLTFKTASGNEYKIESFNGDKDKFIEQIKKDIAAGGFEVH